MRQLGGNGLGAVNTVRNFMSLVKEIDFDEVRERAEQPPRVLVIGATDAAARTTADAIFGTDAGRSVEARGSDNERQINPAQYDAIVVADPDNIGLLDAVKRTLTRSATGNLYPIQRAGNPGDVANLRAQILGATLDMAPSYGRHFPEFAAPAIKEIVNDSARANAQFALVSNIPAVIPILGGFVSAGADLIVLTKNQVMMSYKIAAVHGRDLHDQGAIIRELAPVVGSGFLWRTVAREAVSFLPFAAGTIPKVAIAYAGTFAIGRAIDFYYSFGKKPNGDQLRAFVKQAAQTADRIGLGSRAGTTSLAPAALPAPDSEQHGDTENINPS